jgi:hypothetical protein
VLEVRTGKDKPGHMIRVLSRKFKAFQVFLDVAGF